MVESGAAKPYVKVPSPNSPPIPRLPKTTAGLVVKVSAFVVVLSELITTKLSGSKFVGINYYKSVGICSKSVGD